MSKEITSQNSEVQEISELQDYTLRSTDAVCVNESHLHHKWYYNFKYLAVGILFGIVFVKAEIISWFRIQEMFRFQSFHMYGVIGSAIMVGMVSVWLIKKFKLEKYLYSREPGCMDFLEIKYLTNHHGIS